MSRPLRQGREVRILRGERLRHCLIIDVNDKPNEIKARVGTVTNGDRFLSTLTRELATETRPNVFISGEIKPDISPFINSPLIGLPNLELNDPLYGRLDKAVKG
jgi:hypothetical protein